jgi:hypothetical protein
VSGWVWVALSPLFWVMIALPLAVFVGKFIKAGSGVEPSSRVDDWDFDDQRLFR